MYTTMLVYVVVSARPYVCGRKVTTREEGGPETPMAILEGCPRGPGLSAGRIGTVPATLCVSLEEIFKERTFVNKKNLT